MTPRRLLLGAAIVAGAALLGFLALSRGLEQLAAPPPEALEAGAPEETLSGDVPHIQVTVYLGDPDGEFLVPVRREGPLADDLSEQCRQIVLAQLAAAQPPLVPVIPIGTALRGFFVTDRGDAFIDLSVQVSTAHPGGATTELLTVYALVNAVTTNLATIQRVQLLVDGREVDTLAGHVDLRRPLERNVSLVRRATAVEQ